MWMTISTSPGSSMDRGDTVKKPAALLIGRRVSIEGAIAADSACSSSDLRSRLSPGTPLLAFEF
jgi:hypothetical protein